MSLYAWGAVILIVLGLAWLLARAWKRLGKMQAEANRLQAVIDQARKAKKIDADTSRLSDDELNDRLRGDS